jgi:hypothetical protein
MTKIKLNLHDLLSDALGGQTTHLPATVEVSDLLDFHNLSAYVQDLDELLLDNQLIAHIWSVQDVKSIWPNLDDDQAWTVLQRVEELVDRHEGITWDILQRTACDLFGTDNLKRIERFERAIGTYNDDLPESNLIDSLADAMHWCRGKGLDFEQSLAMAKAHFAAETSKQGE